MEIAQFPADQNRQEQENGESDAQRQCKGHLVPSLFVVVCVFHHEKQRRGQAANNQYKRK